MARQRHLRRRGELRYQYGVHALPVDELIICASLDEARFLAANGGKLVLREILTTFGEWTAASPDPEGTA